MRSGCCAGRIAMDPVATKRGAIQITEGARVLITGLRFAVIEVNRVCMDAHGGAGFEPVQREA